MIREKCGVCLRKGQNIKEMLLFMSVDEIDDVVGKSRCQSTKIDRLFNNFVIFVEEATSRPVWTIRLYKKKINIKVCIRTIKHGDLLGSVYTTNFVNAAVAY